MGIGFVPFSPLGKGFATARSTRRHIRSNDSATSCHESREETGKRTCVRRRLSEDVDEPKEAAPAQIALAWVLAQEQKTRIAPIPGTTKPESTRGKSRRRADSSAPTSLREID